MAAQSLANGDRKLHSASQLTALYLMLAHAGRDTTGQVLNIIYAGLPVVKKQHFHLCVPGGWKYSTLLPSYSFYELILQHHYPRRLH